MLIKKLKKLFKGKTKEICNCPIRTNVPGGSICDRCGAKWKWV